MGSGLGLEMGRVRTSMRPWGLGADTAEYEKGVEEEEEGFLIG